MGLEGYRKPEKTTPKTPRLAMIVAALLTSLSPGKSEAQDLQEAAMGHLIQEAIEPKGKVKPADGVRFSTSFEDMPPFDFITLLEKLDGIHLDARVFTEEMPQYVEFCNELLVFCDHFSRKVEGVTYIKSLTPDVFEQISNINLQANRKIQGISDQEQYSVREKWTIPGTKGDCEDYVLLKLTNYITEGFDPDDMHIIVVRDEAGEGHAVLGLDVYMRGKKTTLVLDNKTESILTLSEMGQKYKGSLFTARTRSAQGTKLNFFRFDTNENP